MPVSVVFGSDRWGIDAGFVVIGDRERCLQAGMVSGAHHDRPGRIRVLTVDRVPRMTISPVRFSFFFLDCVIFVLTNGDVAIDRVLIAEPLRRGDLLNAINKLAGERSIKQKHSTLRRTVQALNDR